MRPVDVLLHVSIPQVSELDKQTRGILTVEDMIIPPPVSKSTLEEIPDTEDTESSPFQDGKGLKQMRGVPGACISMQMFL